MDTSGARYQIIQEVGRGGVGVLYLAIDQNLQRVVALKRVRREATSSLGDEQEDKLVREARALSSLQHPNVVSVYDVGVDEEGVFVVMEYVHGESLDKAVGRTALNLDDLKTVVTHTMEGMASAHIRGLIHRDMKPANLMVDWRDEDKFTLKLVDFGLVRFVEMPTMQTAAQANAIMGTVYFMAPEQFELKTIDEKTDLYSLGCVYYHSLTRKYPFEGESTAQVMSSHLTNTFVPLAERRPDLPPEVVEWVENLMARNPEDRPESAKKALELYPYDTKPVPDAKIPSYVGPLTAPPKTEDPSLALTLPVTKTGEPITSSTSKPSTTGRNSLVTTSQTGPITSPIPDPNKSRSVGAAAAAIFLGMLLLGGVGAAWYMKPWDQGVASANEAEAVEELKKTLGDVVSRETELLNQAHY
ncbi:MAG: serine/threonine-protein kinase [Verrucomicrobiota bacterium]